MRKPLLFLAYHLVLTPYGAVRRYVRDPLARRWDRRATSYFLLTDRRA